MTSLRHLLARAVAVEQRVRRAVEARQRVDPDPDDAFRGPYLTEENVARLLDEDGVRSFPPRDEQLIEEVPDSRLTTLAAEFGLTALDIEILLIALVPDLDDRFEAFYGYLNDDVTRRRPSIGLALGLCGSTPADQVGRARLAGRSPLRAGGLLLVEDLDRPFLSRALRVPDRVTAHLLGDDTPDPRLADLLAPWHAVPGVGDPAPLAGVLADGVQLAYLSASGNAAGRRPGPGRIGPVRRRLGHGQDDVGGGHRGGSGPGPVHGRSGDGDRQIRGRDREEPGAHLHGGGGRERRPAPRRGGRDLRQTLGREGRTRPLRQRGERVPPATHGVLRRVDHPGDESPRQPGRRVHPPPRPGRRLPPPGPWGWCRAERARIAHGVPGARRLPCVVVCRALPCPVAPRINYSAVSSRASLSSPSCT